MYRFLSQKYLTGAYSPAKSLFLLVSSTLLVTSTLYSSVLCAKGVSAGIDIKNKAIINYSMDGTVQSPIESSPSGNSLPGIGNGKSTLFKVDRKVDLSITSNGDTSVTLGETLAELNFTLSNDGNDTQVFSLTSDGALTADNFDSSNCKIEITGVTGTPLPDVVLPTFSSIKLSPDQRASISVRCDIPFDNNGQTILNDHKSLLSIHAEASENKDGSKTTEDGAIDSADSIETVFTDSSGTDDTKRDAAHSTRANYIALASSNTTPPTLNIKKTIVDVVAPKGGNKAVSGSKVTYKITISTLGNGIINNVIITDPTPSGMTYKSGSISLNNINLTDISDADQGRFSTQNNISTINIGDITAGTQQEIKLTYTID